MSGEWSDMMWSFAYGDLALVAYFPSEGNSWQCTRLDEPGGPATLNPKGRAVVRALLNEALRLLDESEPTRANLAGSR